MTSKSSPFVTAERYIQLRKVCAPESWGDTMIRINEMIVAPLITIFFIFLDGGDMMSFVTCAMSTYKVWSEWIEFQSLRFEMQQMYLHTMKVGGPFIVTNDSAYLPYVYADAVLRTHASGTTSLLKG